MPATHRRAISKDEELGKRDDDLRPRSQASLVTNVTKSWRWRKRRIFAVLAGIFLVYVFIHNIPTDLGPLDRRIGMPLRPGHVAYGSQELKEPKGAPPRTSVNSEQSLDNHYYDGKVKFFRLAASLHGISRTMGSRPTNRNVLFAASSLKSVANLMPMACKMGSWDRNYVHLVILGRDALPLQDILDVNGVGEENCHVHFHDGRPDFSDYSSEARAEVSVAGAMKHINDFMHPQAIIMDDSSLEDSFFTRAMRRKAKEMRRALIEIPDGKYEDFLWMTRLDSGSLASWFKPTIDLLIHVPPQTSGGLLRLIDSLRSADYTGLKAPRLTIELPSSIEPFAKRYLERLNWPPEAQSSPMKTSTLALRHRIPSAKVTSEQASLRFLESFYPSSTEDNHVLVLSPQVELNPSYMHFLYYTILEYKYSSYGYQDSEDLLGISLDIPTTAIDGVARFTAPTVSQMRSKKYTKDSTIDKSSTSPFLYGTASSSASLIFGEKWATFHNFLTNRLAASHLGKAEKTTKLVSETEPAWVEYLLELMRARGWSMLHPSSAFVTVHNELNKIPEEYIREKESTQEKAEDTVATETADDEPFLTAPDPPILKEIVEPPSNDDSHSLLDALPFEGDLPELPHLPYLDHTGGLIQLSEVHLLSDRFAAQFRKRIGGCAGSDAERKRVIQYLKTDDLFCLSGIEPEYDDEDDIEDEDEDATVAEAIVKATDVPAVDPQPATDNAQASEHGVKKGAGDETNKKSGEESKEDAQAEAAPG